MDVGLRSDTLSLNVIIQEVAKFNVLLEKFSFFRKGLSQILEIEEFKKYDKFYEKKLEKQFEYFSVIIYKKY